MIEVRSTRGIIKERNNNIINGDLEKASHVGPEDVVIRPPELRRLAFRVSGFGFRVSGSGFRVCDLDFMGEDEEICVWGLRVRVEGRVLSVQDSRFEVEGLGFRVEDAGFGVWGLGGGGVG